MFTEIKEHSEDIKHELTQAVMNFLRKTDGEQPTSVSIKISADKPSKTTIYINIKD